MTCRALLVGLMAMLAACSRPVPDRRGPAADILEKAHRDVQTELFGEKDIEPGNVAGRATVLLAPKLEPHRDILRAHAKWQLDGLAPLAIDLDAYRDAVPEAQIDMPVEAVRAQLGIEVGETWWTLAWDPVRLASLVRTVAIFQVLPIEDAARRVGIDSVAPLSIQRVDGDADAPVLALVSGPEVFVVSLAWQSGSYLPTRVRWLTRSPE